MDETPATQVEGDDGARLFAYRAVDAKGNKVSGELRASDRDDARDRIKAMGLFPYGLAFLSGPPEPPGLLARSVPTLVAVCLIAAALAALPLLARLLSNPAPAPPPVQPAPAPIDPAHVEAESGEAESGR